MLSKELFCNLLSWAIDQEKKERKLTEAMQEFTGDKDFTGFFTHNADFMVEWLKKAMNDEDDWISWWMWDAEHGTADEDLCTVTEKDGRKWVLRTVEDLYDFLFHNYPLSGIQQQIIVSAQGEGVKFALRELALAKVGFSLTDTTMQALMKLLLNKIHDNYMLETGSDPLMDMENYTVEQPNLFRKQK